MRFLITNDDGIDAPGIASLHETICRFAELRRWKQTEIWVVAPDRGRSECSHSVTTSRDLQLTQVRPGWFSLDGTPVDCVRVALSCLCPHVDAVFSGINAGANVGIDLLVSGTFAAAREAAIQGKPAMAISHYRRPDVPKTWDHAPVWLEPTLMDFFKTLATDQSTEIDGIENRTCPQIWNVNLPATDPQRSKPPKAVNCPIDRTPTQRAGTLHQASFPIKGASLAGSAPSRETERLPISTAPTSTHVQLKSDFHGRPRTPGSDVDLCFSGNLTISRIEPLLVG